MFLGVIFFRTRLLISKNNLKTSNCWPVSFTDQVTPKYLRLEVKYCSSETWMTEASLRIMHLNMMMALEQEGCFVEGGCTIIDRQARVPGLKFSETFKLRFVDVCEACCRLKTNIMKLSRSNCQCIELRLRFWI